MIYSGAILQKAILSPDSWNVSLVGHSTMKSLSCNTHQVRRQVRGIPQLHYNLEWIPTRRSGSTFPSTLFLSLRLTKVIQSPREALCHLLGHTLSLCVCQENYVSALDKLLYETENVEIRIFIEHHVFFGCCCFCFFFRSGCILYKLIFCDEEFCETEDGNHHSWQPPSMRLNTSRLSWSVSAFVLGVDAPLWSDVVPLVLWFMVLCLCRSVTSKLLQKAENARMEQSCGFKSSNSY